MKQVRVHPEVERALKAHEPVVALESAVITSGLPRDPMNDQPACDAPGWQADQPINLEAARLMERAVRTAGAVPATIAVIDGYMHIGLDDDVLSDLARNEEASKTSVTDLPLRIATGATAGTTVSATLAACGLPEAGHIQVMATGGIGGVHRDWTEHPDISADLRQIALTPTCVVCAGSKSVLDVGATAEVLEALGVTVVGYQTDVMPQFYCLGSEKLPVPGRLDDVASVVAACRFQWQTLNRQSGVLLTNPPPKALALDGADVDQIVSLADALANARGMTGRDRTPFLLAELAKRTGGRSLQVNIALLQNNAILAGQLAVAMAGD